MPRKRDPIKRLTVDEWFNLSAAEYAIRDMWRKLGGTVCDCGRLTMQTVCERCPRARQ